MEGVSGSPKSNTLQMDRSVFGMITGCGYPLRDWSIGNVKALGECEMFLWVWLRMGRRVRERARVCVGILRNGQCPSETPY